MMEKILSSHVPIKLTLFSCSLLSLKSVFKDGYAVK